MTTTEKARIAAEIEAFDNTDFSDCPELTDDQLAQLRPSHYRKQAAEESGYNTDERNLVIKYRRLDGQGRHEIRALLDAKLTVAEKKQSVG
ncbi:MAG: hypothetical protein FWB78_06630 [Treponema sp.]|nr:hypothetical protein [Treponema sp.]